MRRLLAASGDSVGSSGSTGRRQPVLAVCGVVAGCLLSQNAMARVPASNETIYLPLLMRRANPSLLGGDWTFRGLPPDRPLFDLLFRPLAATGSWAFTGWTGRVVGWLAVAAALVWLLSTLGVRRPVVVTAVVVGSLANQLSPVAGEWVTGPFESKVFAYAALFAMLSALARRHWLAAGLLGGIAFSLHSVVGFWTVVVLVAVSLVLRLRGSALRRVGFGLLGGALPAVPAMAHYVGRSTSMSNQNLRIITRHVLSFHLDPAAFARRDMAILAVLAVVGGLFDRNTRRGSGFSGLFDSAGWRVWRTAEVVSLVAFAGGCCARLLGWDSVLLTMPCRLAGVLIPLGTLSRVAVAVGAFRRTRSSGPASQHRVRVVVVVLSLVTLLCLVGSGGPSLRNRIRSGSFFGRASMDDTGRALVWSRTHLPAGAVVAVSPARKGVFAALRRPTVASFYTVRFDAVAAWRARVEDLAGTSLTSASGYALAQLLDAGYERRPLAAVRRWATSYGVTHVVSTSAYPLPVVFRSGATRVYVLAP